MAKMKGLGKRLVASLIAIIMVSGFLMAYHQSQRGLWLSIGTQDSEDLKVSHTNFLMVAVDAGDVITYKWLHSFELIPWTEYFRVADDGSLVLYQIEVAGFGAGIPENKGEMTVSDGMVIMTNFEESFESINWIHSQTALQSIGINENIIVSGTSLPHHKPMRLEVKERSFK